MKTILFTLSLALIAFGAFAIAPSTANACATCGCSEMKKSCDCGKDHQHGQKTCGCKDKKIKMKPCKVCEKSEKAWNKKYKPMKDHSEKGSVTFMSRGAIDDGFND
jgi:hypothetical protein